MKATELRIGNWVEVFFTEDESGFGKDYFSQITSVLEYKVMVIDDHHFHQIDRIRPIPLTPEILEKAGFEKYEWTDGYFIKTKFGDFMITFFRGRTISYFTNISRDRRGMKMGQRRYVGNINSTENIQHLHQLQNGIYFLTGEELNIEL